MSIRRQLRVPPAPLASRRALRAARSCLFMARVAPDNQETQRHVDEEGGAGRAQRSSARLLAYSSPTGRDRPRRRAVGSSRCGVPTRPGVSHAGQHPQSCATAPSSLVPRLPSPVPRPPHVYAVARHRPSRVAEDLVAHQCHSHALSRRAATGLDRYRQGDERGPRRHVGVAQRDRRVAVSVRACVQHETVHARTPRPQAMGGRRTAYLKCYDDRSVGHGAQAQGFPPVEMEEMAGRPENGQGHMRCRAVDRLPRRVVDRLPHRAVAPRRVVGGWYSAACRVVGGWYSAACRVVGGWYSAAHRIGGMRPDM